ncbi:GNAT family N-acetyltransferase [Streptomyces albus subsp. chlorinus]|nr:GNAT family N-acetyltransferase [Streptomyces albus subsp. chlorinus]
MKVERVAWEHPDAVALRARQRAEIAARYGRPDSEPGVPPSADDIAAFFVAYGADQADEGDEGDEEDGTASSAARGPAVGCAGLRHLGSGAGEIKRMYVEPAWRGTGAATRLLRTLEEWAAGRGWTELRLETGDAQPDAVRFYTRCGYARIPNFGAYAGRENSWCFGRRLP